ncbi:hypothetical protein SAMD00019534_114740, partial [Acytostelium subglobosum LB1]|uniref:hypothetical protein n=1 Tax=Acytostelium subglobosum LB1 TaxID=1410327 RepID=UPI000644F70C
MIAPFIKNNNVILVISTTLATISLFVLSYIYRSNGDRPKSISSPPSPSPSSPATTTSSPSTTTTSTPTVTPHADDEQHKKNTELPIHVTNDDQSHTTESKNETTLQLQNVEVVYAQEEEKGLHVTLILDPVHLPHSIIVNIFELLTYTDYQRCKSVNMNWNKILCKLDRVWKHYIGERWGYSEIPDASYEPTDYYKHFKARYIEEWRRVAFKPETHIISIHEQ